MNWTVSFQEHEGVGNVRACVHMCYFRLGVNSGALFLPRQVLGPLIILLL